MRRTLALVSALWLALTGVATGCGRHTDIRATNSEVDAWVEQERRAEEELKLRARAAQRSHPIARPEERSAGGELPPAGAATPPPLARRPATRRSTPTPRSAP